MFWQVIWKSCRILLSLHGRRSGNAPPFFVSFHQYPSKMPARQGRQHGVSRQSGCQKPSIGLPEAVNWVAKSHRLGCQKPSTRRSKAISGNLAGDRPWPRWSACAFLRVAFSYLFPVLCFFNGCAGLSQPMASHRRRRPWQGRPRRFPCRATAGRGPSASSPQPHGRS